MVAMFTEFHRLTHHELVDRLIDTALAEVPGRLRRECPAVADAEFTRRGVRRVLDRYESGRDFIQAERQAGGTIVRSTYFENLHSDRRRKLIEATGDALRSNLSRWFAMAGINHLSVFPELAGRAVCAADGHYIAHACHAARDDKGRQVAFGNIYALDLASGLSFPVCAILSGHSMHPNEWALLKKSDRKFLRKAAMGRMGWSAAHRPLLVYDRAGADAEFMEEQAMLGGNGFDMITRAKENMCIRVLAANRFDLDDQVNAGVLHDARVRLANGVELRVVVYRCPEAGEKYRCITTEQKLRPGVIAWLYFMRWRIEKVFDVFERKLGEDKAWSTDDPANGARPCQSEFICIAYNILLFVQAVLATDAGISDIKSAGKREKELARRQREVEMHNEAVMAKAKKKRMTRRPRGLRSLNPLLAAIVRQWHQMTRQFIRCFRNLLHAEKSLAECFGEYERYLAAYI